MLRIEAYEKFKERILSGELKPGQMVSQRELANLADIPLGPAREAIQRLAFESLLRVHPNRGIQVSEVTYRTIRSAYQLRTILEVEAIKKFVISAEDELIHTLINRTEEILARADEVDDPKFMAEAVEVDWQMHDAFIASLDNEIISESHRINHSRIALFRVTNRFATNRLEPALSEHLGILQCCRVRDVEGAETLLREHINVSKETALTEL